MKKIVPILLTLALSACISAGSHGSIRNYKYLVAKSDLQNAINNVLNADSTIVQSNYSYYNDNKKYITFKIESNNSLIEYTFRYYGDSSVWKNSKDSEIFICYVFDGKGNGGSEGNGGWKKMPKEKRKTMLDLFETKFVDKVNKELNKNHTVY